jgi:hypothetical protein
VFSTGDISGILWNVLVLLQFRLIGMGRNDGRELFGLIVVMIGTQSTGGSGFSLNLHTLESSV